MSLEKYAIEEFKRVKKKRISLLIDKKETQKNPKAFILGGQSGAGKSVLGEKIINDYDNNIILINGDEYRKFHPRFKELENKYGIDSVKYTQDFSGKMTEALIQELSNMKYNLIIEGTLRTSEVPLKTANLLKNKNYKVHLSIMSVKPYISYLSTLYRYYKNLYEGNIARATPKEHHDLIVENIGKNLEVIDKTNIFESIELYDRSLNILYDSKTKNTLGPGETLTNFFKESYLEEEIRTIERTSMAIENFLNIAYEESHAKQILREIKENRKNYPVADNKKIKLEELNKITIKRNLEER